MLNKLPFVALENTVSCSTKMLDLKLFTTTECTHKTAKYT